ncbi:MULTISPECIES: YraN family protein [Alicyclobacillus]|uniref:Putative endonuclease n=2 Tax=Alicyclobacillus tolerans TaxID=90970 RepID=A0A1M6RT62_9BACL|nr:MULTISPECIES: YraN family protein [Alicyclobacillus]SHK35604.1 putative endonuclease [Alicyclobacillus montanus]
MSQWLIFWPIYLPMSGNRELGQKGERLAREYVKRTLGWHILSHNWRCSFGELDIIAQKSNKIIAIEVKTRSASLTMGYSNEAATTQKIKRMFKLLQYYLVHEQPMFNSIEFPEIQLDWIDIVMYREEVISFSHFTYEN